MPTNKITIEEIIRINSAKGILFNALKDGKVHKFSVIRKALVKQSGISTQGYAVTYGLGRVLCAAKFPKQLQFDRENDTIQLVSATPAKKAAKPVAKKAAKPVAKKAAPKATPVVSA